MTVTMNGLSTDDVNAVRIECEIYSPFVFPNRTVKVPSHASWTLNNYARAGTFSAEFAYDDSVSDYAKWFDPPDPATGEVVKLDFQIWPSYLDPGQSPYATRGSNAVCQFQGLIDHVSHDPVMGMVQVNGRDYSVLLLDYAVDDAFLNRTASEIVQQLATDVGLMASVTPTTAIAGRFFSLSHVRHTKTTQSRFKNAWDLLSKLASYEQYDLWVDGKTVNFHPAYSNDVVVQAKFQTPGASGYAFPIANFASAQCERDLIIAKGVQVRISSWDAAQRKASIGLWPRSAKANAIVYSPSVAPNLRQAQVDALAVTIYNDIVAHLRSVTFTVPGDLTMQPRQSLRLSGTETTWDRLYRIDSIQREMSLRDGFQQTVVARTRDAAGDAS